MKENEQKASRTLVQINLTSLSEKENKIPGPIQLSFLMLSRRALAPRSKYRRTDRSKVGLPSRRLSWTCVRNTIHRLTRVALTRRTPNADSDTAAHPDIKMSLRFRSGQHAVHLNLTYISTLVHCSHFIINHSKHIEILAAWRWAQCPSSPLVKNIFSKTFLYPLLPSQPCVQFIQRLLPTLEERLDTRGWFVRQNYKSKMLEALASKKTVYYNY